jgi:gamma-glutamyltranspeptidase/glutathione hydrolase
MIRNDRRFLALVCLFLPLLASACRQEQPRTQPQAEVAIAPDASASVRTAWVSSASPEATEAGLEILKAGGNAVDAAVAGSFALGVAEPAMSGLGGQTQIVLFRPESGALVINGTSRAPIATPRNATAEQLRGHRATTVPTTARVLEYAHRNYGSRTLDFSQLLAPAIRYAENGVVLGPFRRRVLQRHVEDLRTGSGTARLFLTEDGALPAEGETLRQPALARTLKRLAEDGPLAFYHGEIAEEIAADMRANDGWLAISDLETLPEPVELDPLHGS